MIRVHLTPADLGRIRFGSSAVLEISLGLRSRGERGDGLLAAAAASVERARRSLRLWLSDPLHEPGRYVPDFLPPRGMGVDVPIAQDLAALRGLEGDRVERHVAFAYPDGVPADLDLFRISPTAAVGRLADEFAAVWQHGIAPIQPALRALVEADLVYRARRLAVDGPEALFTDLHQDVGYRDGVVEIASDRDADLYPGGRGMTLMPTVFAWPRVYAVANPRAHPGIAYPPRGIALLEQILAPKTRRDRLARLLGAGRAAVLRGLAEPTTTQELSIRLGVTPSAVSQHLSALSEAGLIVGTRLGRRVYYRVNDDGAEMLRVLDSRLGPRLI